MKFLEIKNTTHEILAVHNVLNSNILNTIRISNDSYFEETTENTVGKTTGFRYEDGSIIENPLIVTLEDAQKQAIKAINNRYSEQRRAKNENYPPEEIDTFPRKQKEAEAYEREMAKPEAEQLADNSVLTPRLLDMVGGDEVKRIELITAILGHATEISQLEGQMIGTRDLVKAAADVEAVEVIMTSIGL